MVYGKAELKSNEMSKLVYDNSISKSIVQDCRKWRNVEICNNYYRLDVAIEYALF